MFVARLHDRMRLVDPRDGWPNTRAVALASGAARVLVTGKVAKRGWRIYEVPISYHGRSYDEGKKIGWKDGVVAIWTILKTALTDPGGNPRGAPRS